MTYQAIARKWRPETFDEIAGQTHVTQTLRNALSLRRIHHAFLFTGARGVGKTTAARAFARALNCAEGPTATPCGVCASCHEVPLGNSSDVTEIDGASNNSVDDVRSLRDAVRYLPSRDRYRIYIIDEVHMLSIGAFNALLKTLEEPPPHVIFIFATTEAQKIPETILSRVQRFDFKRIPETVVVKRLSTICQAEGVDIPEGGLRLIARAGEGSMRDAQSLLDQVIAFGGEKVSAEQVARILGLVDRELLHSFLEGLLAGQPERCLDVIARIYDYGYELSQFTSEILELLRNAALVVLSEGARRHLDVPAEEQERLARVCEGVGVETFSRYFQVMLQVHDEVSRASRPRLVLEMAVARLAAVRPLQPVDHLLLRLEELERRLRGAGHTPRPGPRQGVRNSEGPAQRVASLRRDEEDEVPTTLHGLDRVPLDRVTPDQVPQDRVTQDSAPPSRPERVTQDRFTQDRVTQDRVTQDRVTQDRPTGGLRERWGARPPTPEPSPAPARAPRPSPPPPEADDNTRFAALCKQLRGGTMATFADNTFLAGRKDAVLRVLAPQAFVKRFEGNTQDPLFRELLAVFFPGVNVVEVAARGEGEGVTYAEARRERHRLHEESLKAEVLADPIFQKAQEILGFTQFNVHPLSYPEDP